ncbi:MAG: hypothetical protein ACE5FT_03100 [Candidatus Nanoarchaeia archaeon]
MEDGRSREPGSIDMIIPKARVKLDEGSLDHDITVNLSVSPINGVWLVWVDGDDVIKQALTVGRGPREEWYEDAFAQAYIIYSNSFKKDYTVYGKVKDGKVQLHGFSELLYSSPESK